ncbi:MAG: histidine triad nucleotide-binding protein [Alphaproteobacteria bacterium CG11_big_fil_rev_8_21_14_0_20_44_7]|nr:MAG: histidine triad nucleotide-binding protein [Alphaproteobacteria bacterium CG11_big_fil_rev_8_21_14_0_20_44_7]
MAYDKENIFAKIIRGEIPAAKIYEDDDVLAFEDISKAAPVHVLVVPKGDFVSFDDFAKSGADKVANFFAKVQKIAADLGLVENGYRLITNHGADASQSVAHFHVHILGGRELGGLLDDDEKIR